MPKATYHLYERDGAVYRRQEGYAGAREVKDNDGNWAPYTGDAMKPVTFGDYLGTEEHETQAA
jgi:hypothetical protein